MKDILDKLDERRASARGGGGKRRIDNQHKRGKLTARERIELLMDRDSFQEFDMFVEHRSYEFGMEKTKIAGDGVVTGWGTVNGRSVFVFAKDFTVFGGALSETHAQKIIKIQDMAMRARAPIIGLFDAGGARIQEGVAALGGYGEVFKRNVTRLRRHPADFRDHGAVRRRRRLFAGDDRLHLHGARHELHVRHRPRRGQDGDQRDRHRGGTGRRLGARHQILDRRRRLRQRRRDVCCRCAGWSISCRRIFPPACRNGRRSTTSTASSRRSTRLVPDNPNKPYDIKELILKVVDEGDFFELSETFARNIVIGFGRIGGRTVGFVANQPMVLAGVLDCDASRKAARFVRFCDAFNIPIVTFVDVPGFLPGTAQEYGGLIKHGAKLLFAYSQATVPLVTVITRKAFGGAYDVMASKHIGGDVNYAWPTAQIAVMGAKGAVEIIFRADIGDPEKIAARTKEYEERFLSPFIAAERGYIDDVIMPHATRAAHRAGAGDAAGEDAWRCRCGSTIICQSRLSRVYSRPTFDAWVRRYRSTTT